MMSLLSPFKEDFFMLYTIVVNDWGETTYVPTTLGNILLIILLAALLVLAVFLARRNTLTHTDSSAASTATPQPNTFAKTSVTAQKTNYKLSAKQLAFCAMAIALGTVLSNFKVYEFPFGGSITLLSMLVICLPGYWFGPGAGIITGVAYGVLQLLVDPYVLFPLQLLVDYPLAFGALGLSGLFANSKNGLFKGYLVAILGRYLFAVLSGWIFFGTYAWDGWAPLPYSLAYNACYIFAEGAITLAILAIPAVKNALMRVKKLASE